MTYASGGLIEASDLNGFVNSINTFWSTGTGNAGYGQTSIGTVSANGVVNASNWASLINALNNARLHQSGSNSGIAAPSAGDTITYISTLSTQLTSAYNNRLVAVTTGATITGTNDTWSPAVGATTALYAFRDCNVIFGTSNQARYFFNAGGRIAMTYSAVSNAANARSNNMRDMINQIIGFGEYRGYSNSGILGSGGYITVNNTNAGYYNALNQSAVTFIQNDDTVNPYAGSKVQVEHFTTGSTTNGATGNAVVFRLFLVSPADDASGGSINVTVTSRCDITVPSTTYLSNSWGFPIITYDSV